jgi:hypothetical protein
MKHLVIGAGATLAEALELANPRERCPPLIRDFARRLWANYTPHPVLEAYLRELGHHELERDPRELFYRLEDEGQVNIELFLEFAWNNRHRTWKLDEGNRPPGYISGLRATTGGAVGSEKPYAGEGQFWEDLLYHGIGMPLTVAMAECFFENGKGWKELALSKAMAARLQPGDAVLNLNYDTVFELALTQLGRPFVYLPHPAPGNRIEVCKPHGSLNMVVNTSSFTFGQPGWLGTPQPPAYSSYSGIIPPRMNKNYAQHPIARLILNPLVHRRPTTIVLWGTRLTESDVDLCALYKRWAEHANRIDVINPSAELATRVGQVFGRPIAHFSSLERWLHAEA